MERGTVETRNRRGRDRAVPAAGEEVAHAVHSRGQRVAVRRARWRAAGVRILLGYRFHDARPVAYPSGDPRRYRETSVAAGGAIRSGLVSESLPVLAGVLRAAPESDALVILGRPMDS